MPRLTVVVPVYQVRAYLSECLDSVFAQEGADFEVVAVDDCSPDGSGAILDAYAERDARLRVIHLGENVGLGRARNAGLAAAHGDYVLFLDSDDTLAEGALKAISERLAHTGDPDVLVFDYARSHWDGRIRRNLRADLLRSEGPATFSLADRPELLDLLQVAWNKAYRRAFVTGVGLVFPPGYYEDAPWTYRCLTTARRIALLDRVCLYYRQRREGSNILRTVSRGHFDVFDQYRRVFEHLDAHEELARWRDPLFRKMVDHYLTVLRRRDRLPPGTRAEFFHRASADYRARVPSGFVRPPGNQGRKYALLERDAYAAMAVATRAVRTRHKVVRRARAVARTGRHLATRLFYRAQLRRPLDENLALFSAYWHRGVACNPAAIDAELGRLAPGVRRVWAVRPEAADRVPAGVEYVRVGSRAYWSTLARATYLVNNVNFGDSTVKRPGQVHVQTHHGTPLKTMGLDQRRYPASTDMDFAALLRRCDRWDYSITSNRHSTVAWERAYPCSYTTLETGYPRNDVLASAGVAEVRKAREDLGLGEGRRVFLYLPTHREYQPGFVPPLDPARFARRLGPDVTLLVRGHYFYGNAPHVEDVLDGARVVDVTAHPRVEELYLAADALITDYSSAMFDYAVLDRPIVVHAPDWEVYSAVRGTYFDLLREPPGAVATDEEGLIRLIESGEYAGEEAARLRDAFRRRFCALDDGRAAERVVRRVFLGQRDVPPVVPFDRRPRVPTPAEALGAADAEGSALA
ncbi:CDP-glycerol glycerophosphotransferase family protein [Streptomyces sp. ZYX-F-203]